MGFNARVILDSIGPNGARLTTFEMTLPRIVLAEFNTHRMFSRNSASSRAIPVTKMLERVRTAPFIPEYWGKNQKGMQADEELPPDAQHAAISEWTHASLDMYARAHALLEIGVHKQIANRLLEPFLWHVIIFTATELSNFIALRANKAAAPEIRRPAEMLVGAYEDSKPMELLAGEWHLPLVTNYDLFVVPGILPTYDEPGSARCWAVNTSEHPDVSRLKHLQIVDWHRWAMISAARCARVSYLTHEGKRDLEEDVRKSGELQDAGHMSPFEHPARALSTAQWQNICHAQSMEWMTDRHPVGNFWGWKQLRKTIADEHDFAKIVKR